MSMMVCQILLCVYACLKQQNYAKFVNDSNHQREDAYWGENALTIPLQYFVIVTVYSEPAIGNMSILLFKKIHIIFFKYYKLNKYTYENSNVSNEPSHLKIITKKCKRIADL